MESLFGYLNLRTPSGPLTLLVSIFGMNGAEEVLKNFVAQIQRYSGWYSMSYP